MQPLQIKAPEIKAPQDFRLQMKSNGSVAQTYKAPVQAQSGIDQDVVRLAKAIRQHETGNRPIQGQTGETASRYQFLPSTWKSGAAKYLGDPNAQINLENENKVAYSQIKEWKDKGYSPAQIAAAWNAGEGILANDAWKTHRGVSSSNPNVRFDTPAYVASVGNIYQQLKTSEPPIDVASVTGEEEVPKQDGILASMGKGLVSSLAKPFTTPFAGVYSGITGKDVEVPWYLGGEKISSSGTKEGFETTARNTGQAALETAGLLATGGAVRSAVPFLKGTASAGKTIAAEALAGGLGGAAYGAGATLGEEGATAGRVATSGLIGGVLGAGLGAAVPTIGTIAGKGTSAVFGKSSESGGNLLSRIIKTGMKDFEFGREPLEQVAKEGIVGNTLEELVQNIGKRKQEVGQAIGRQIDASPANLVVNVNGITKGLDEDIARLSRTPGINKNAISTLSTIRDDVNTLLAGRTEISPKEAFEIKQLIDESVRKWSELDESVKTAALKDIYGKLKDGLNKSIPSLVPLNERYANLATADNAAYKTLLKDKAGTLPRGILGRTARSVFTGGVLGGISGSPITGILAAAVEYGGEQLASNPAVISRIAAFLGRASAAERAAALQAVPQFSQEFIKAIPKIRATGDPQAQKAVDTIQLILQHQGEMSKAKEEIAGEGVQKAFNFADTIFKK